MLSERNQSHKISLYWMTLFLGNSIIGKSILWRQKPRLLLSLLGLERNWLGRGIRGISSQVVKMCILTAVVVMQNYKFGKIYKTAIKNKNKLVCINNRKI